MAVGGVLIVEQPASSVLAEHVAFKYLVKLLWSKKIPATVLKYHNPD